MNKYPHRGFVVIEGTGLYARAVNNYTIDADGCMRRHLIGAYARCWVYYDIMKGRILINCKEGIPHLDAKISKNYKKSDVGRWVRTKLKFYDKNNWKLGIVSIIPYPDCLDALADGWNELLAGTMVITDKACSLRCGGNRLVTHSILKTYLDKNAIMPSIVNDFFEDMDLRFIK